MKYLKSLCCVFLLMNLSACTVDMERERIPEETVTITESIQGETTQEHTGTYVESNYVKLEEYEPEFAYSKAKRLTSYTADSEYTLSAFFTAEGERYVLMKEKPVELSGFAEKVSMDAIVCMDMVSDTEMAVLTAEKEEEGYQCSIWKIGQNGQAECCKLYSVDYESQGLEQSDFVQNAWYCDWKGNQYVLSRGNTKLTIFDEQGKHVLTENYSNGVEDPILPEIRFVKVFQGGEGEIYFAKSDMKEQKTVVYTLNNADKALLKVYEVGQAEMNIFAMPQSNKLYYSQSNRLWSVDLQTQKKKEIFNLTAGNIPNEYVEHLVVSDDGVITFFINRRGNRELVAFSDKVVEETDRGIVFYDFSGTAEQQSYAAKFSRESGNLIQYQKMENTEDKWTRTMADLISGEGPDILCLWAGDVHFNALYEKGILADMNEFVPAEVSTQIFPGIKESGSLNGDWVGVAPYALTETYMVSDELWGKEHWTVEEIINLAENSPQLEHILTYSNKGVNAEAIFEFLLSRHLTRTSFINAEENISNFDSGEFVEVLEFVHKMEREGSLNASQAVQEGECMTARANVWNVGAYKEIVEKFGLKCHFIGHPSQPEEYVGYWNSVYIYVVNKETEHKEEISQYLQYILSDEVQGSVSYYMPVREDIVRSRFYISEWTDEWLYRMEDGTAYSVQKPDGGSYEEELIDFLRKLGPEVNAKDNVVYDIVLEEANYFFQGSKSAEQVAKIIDNRVQLYLDEQHFSN